MTKTSFERNAAASEAASASASADPVAARSVGWRAGLTDGDDAAGGGSMLRGLDKRISLKTKLPVHIAEDPLRAVARGTGIALKNLDKFQFLIKA